MAGLGGQNSLRPMALVFILTWLPLTAAAAVDVPGAQSDARCGRQHSATALPRDHSLIQFQGAFLHASAADDINIGDSIVLTAHTGANVAVNGFDVMGSGGFSAEQQAFIVESSLSVAGTISSGDAVLLKASTGKRISVSDTEVFAKWDHSGTWESFVLQRVAGGGVVRSGDSITLLAHTGNYLSVVDGAVVAKWNHSLSWERFIIHKVTPVSSATAAPKTPAPTLETPVFQGEWVAEHAQCDPEMNCYRLHTVTCKSSTGEDLPSSQCDPGARPPSYEPCHLLGQGVCLNIAPTDCIDVPGCWWNRWHLTCGELAQHGACSEEGVHLEGFSRADAEMVRRVCPVTCSRCTPKALIPPHPGTDQCEADACEDDPGFGGHSQFGIVVSASCSMAQVADCNSLALAEELKAACPKSCGLC